MTINSHIQKKIRKKYYYFEDTEEMYDPIKDLTYKEKGFKMGFRVIESGPLVRSSFHADEQVRQLENAQT